MSSQQMDDLFDILLKSGGDESFKHRKKVSSCSSCCLCLHRALLFVCFLSELPGLKSSPDPSLAPLTSDLSSPASSPSPLQLSSPTHKEPLSSPRPSAGETCAGKIRLEDFLESTTGSPLLGAELDGALTLIDDLHSQMLSTPSILDHPPSPMDTSDLGFSAHSTGLDFDHSLDSMDWLDVSTVGNSSGARGTRGGGGGDGGDGGTDLAPLAPHTPPSVFSTDFLDGTDLQLNWEGL